jgi:hypothetical protein
MAKVQMLLKDTIVTDVSGKAKDDQEKSYIGTVSGSFTIFQLKSFL